MEPPPVPACGTRGGRGRAQCSRGAGTTWLSAVAPGAPAAAAAERRATEFMTTEAWYAEPPPCVSLLDCSPAPAASPYPQDTLHVSVAATSKVVPFGNAISEWRSGLSCPFG
jgi:hypothetical protein